MREKDEAYRILEAALSLASAGVDEAEVSLRGGEMGVARIAGSQLHPASQRVHERLAVRLCQKGRWASATTSDLSTQGITAAAHHARAEIERLPDDLQGEGLPAPQSYIEVDAFDEATASLHGLERTALAARAITAAHRAGVVASGHIAVGRGRLGRDGEPRVYALANTRGLLAYHASTEARFEVRMERGLRYGRAFRAAHALSEMEPGELVNEALWRVTHGDELATLPPGRYVAVLEPQAVSALVRVLGQTAGVRRMMEGESFLSGRLGERVFDPRLTIIDDHRHPAHRGVPFDCDGVARKRVMLVEAGVLRGPVVAWSSSQKYDRPPTGHRIEVGRGRRDEAAEHLVMSGGVGGSEHLVRKTGAGVFISELSDVSVIDGGRAVVAGSTAGGTFAIQGGELTFPVGDLRFEVSLLDLLAHVEGIGTPVWADGAVVPPLCVADFPLSAPA